MFTSISIINTLSAFLLQPQKSITDHRIVINVSLGLNVSLHLLFSLRAIFETNFVSIILDQLCGNFGSADALGPPIEIKIFKWKHREESA